VEAKLEKIENSEAYIGIEVDAQMFEEGMEKAYRKVVKQITIPGFRKGRVPRPLLEAHYGKEILYQDALEAIIPEAYEEALEKLDIKPLAQPKFDIEEIEAGKPLKFQARVAVKPEFELGQIEGLEISIPRFEVTEEDVNNKLEELRSRYAELVEKTEEPAAKGDNVEIDFEGFIDGETFPGGKGTNYPLELGSNTFIPGFEDQLIGMRVGEEKDVQVTFPEDYHAQELAGKDAVFKVKVNKIETKKLRELDDDFVQEVSNFDNVKELTDDIRNNLQKSAEARKQDLIKRMLIDKALANCEIVVADSVIEEQIYHMAGDFEQRIAMQGLSLDQYFRYTGTTMEDLHQQLRPDAEKIVKNNFLLEKIVEEKGITVSDEELNKKIEEVASNMGIDIDKAKESLAKIRDNLESGMKMDKAVQYLVDHAVITEIEEENNKEAGIVETTE